MSGKSLRGLWLVLLLPVLIPALLIIGFWHIGRALVLHTLLLVLWAPRGRRVLFIYSNSPHWKDYCEREILPHLPETAVVRNWSERSAWPQLSLETKLFRAYGGQTEFNPMAITFRPFRPIRVFRFWKPFRDAKHGKPQNLERVTTEFLADAQRQG